MRKLIRSALFAAFLVGWCPAYFFTLKAEVPSSVLISRRKYDSPVTIRLTNSSAREVFAELSQLTGVTIFVDPKIAEDRISIRLTRRTLVQALDAISQAFHYSRTEKTVGNEKQFTVSDDSEFIRLWTQSNQSKQSGFMERLKQENAILAGYSRYSLDELDIEINNLIGKLGKGDSEDIERKRIMSIALGQTILLHNPWQKVVSSLIGNFSGKISDLFDGDGITYYYPALPEFPPIPQSDIEYIQQVSKDNTSLAPSLRYGSIRSVAIKVMPSSKLNSQLNWEAALTIGQRNYTLSSRAFGNLPHTSENPVNTKPKQVAVNQFEKATGLAKPITIDTPYLETVGYFPDGTNRYSLLGPVLETVTADIDFDYVADAFWSSKIRSENLKGQPAAAGLYQVMAASQRMWTKCGDINILVSENLPSERKAEPPMSRINGWMNYIEKGQFGIDEFAEMTQLSARQQETILDMSRHGIIPSLISQLQSARPHLQLWGALDRAQRRKANLDGLSFAELPKELQSKFSLAIFEPGVNQYSSSSYDKVALSQSKLKVTTTEVQQWRVKKDGPTATWRIGRGEDPDNGFMSREEALKRFRMLDPTLKIKDVLPAIQSTVLFSYNTGDRTLARGYVELPVKWESGS